MSKYFNKYAVLFEEIDRLYRTHIVITEACNWRDYDRSNGLAEKAWIAYVEEAFAQLEIGESHIDMGKIMNIALMPDYVHEEHPLITAIQVPRASPGITVREIDNSNGKFRYLPGPVRVGQ